MPVFPTYRARQGLDTAAGSVPRYPTGSPVGGALQDLGGSITSAGLELVREQTELEDFETNAEFEKFKTEQDTAFTAASEAAEGGAKNLAVNALAEYDKKAGELIAKAPERLKDKLSITVGKYRSKWGRYTYENEKRIRREYYKTSLGESADKKKLLAAQQPGLASALARKHSREIDSSGLTAREKKNLKKDHQRGITAAAEESRIKSDPAYRGRWIKAFRAKHSYANKWAVRKQPITGSLKSKIQTAVGAVFGPGYKAVTYSGGQPRPGQGPRKGSTRHDDGHASDTFIIGPNGKKVRGEKLALLGQYWLAKKFGSVGMEMKGGGIHLDEHSKRAPKWYYGKQPEGVIERINKGLKGELPPLAGKDGAPKIAVEDYTPPEQDPEITKAAGVLGYNETMRLVRAAERAEREADKNLKAAQTERNDAYRLAIETGDLTDPDDILNDGLLDDGAKAARIKQWNAKNKDEVSARDTLARINGGEKLNPFDKDDKKNANTLFNQVAQDKNVLSDETLAKFARRFIEKAGIVPDDVSASIRNGLRSPDSMLPAIALAKSILGDSPNTFNGTGGKEIRDAVVEYDTLKRRGMKDAEIVQRFVDARDPEKVKNREAILKANKKWIAKTATASKLEALYGGYFAYDPSVAANPATELARVAEYQGMLEDALINTNGDPDLAKAKADAQFRRIYDVSDLNYHGRTTLMRHAPHLYYPEISGTHEYLRRQAFETVSEAMDGDVRAGSVKLMADDITEKDFLSGQAPRYQLIYSDKKGSLQRLNVWWRPDIKAARADEEKEIKAGIAETKKYLETARKLLPGHRMFKVENGIPPKPTPKTPAEGPYWLGGNADPSSGALTAFDESGKFKGQD